ncbi:MAG TPA: acyl-CoA dehydrogenase [Steroidobacteraceae bacterium]|jgi:alkylation response protein AidB-like acyl-CoA dehydrogenase
MYRAPLEELRFVLEELLGTGQLAACPDLADYSDEVGASILEEAARLAETVLDPLNRPGDREGAHWSPEGVSTPKGFKEAYRQFVSGGWQALGTDPRFGGQRVPQSLSSAVAELWGSSNLSFMLCPMLTHGAVHALELCGSEPQQRLYLPKMVSGEWTGTMVLTEPQAGSDLAQVRTRAVPEGDHYRLFGQKIFITWGEHDYTDNIIHMVLGRMEGAPAGVKGISLFIVPKVQVNADGSLGERNEVRCVSIEHKLGIHASPTCVLQFGHDRGAAGYLVGEPNRGLEYMFVMMNTARLAVGVQSYAVGERAFQQAVEYARTRLQGRPPRTGDAQRLPIIHHPDVRRMLLTMKSCTEASRALSLYAGQQLDLAAFHPEAAVRIAAQARGDLLIPIVKAWSTETANEVAAIGVQVHGGMGFIEETGAAQYVRDVRITTIYEGTTGIQANDLMGRKIGRDHGAAVRALVADMRRELQVLEPNGDAPRVTRDAALQGIGLLESATRSIVGNMAAAPERALAVSVPYLKLCGLVMGGWLLAKSAAIASAGRGAAGKDFYGSKIRTAHFYAKQVLPQAIGLAKVVEEGAASVLEAEPERV